MKILFIGLGLIGGSMALALSGNPDVELYGVDRDEWTRFEALGRDAVRSCWASVEDAPLEMMDVTVLCLHPDAAANFVKTQAHRLKAGSLLTDVCGVKRPLHEAVESLESRAFIYLGGHPMAGRECGGFANATDCADYLTKRGVPFRDAHRVVGELVTHCLNKGIALLDLSMEELKAFHPAFGEDVYDAMSLKACVEYRSIPGGPAPDAVRESIRIARERLAK